MKLDLLTRSALFLKVLLVLDEIQLFWEILVLVLLIFSGTDVFSEAVEFLLSQSIWLQLVRWHHTDLLVPQLFLFCRLKLIEAYFAQK